MKTKEEIFNIFKNCNENIVDTVYKIWRIGYQQNATEAYNSGFDAGYKVCLQDNEFVDPCIYCAYKENEQRCYIDKVNKLIESGLAPCLFCEYSSKNVDEYPCSQCTYNHPDEFKMNMDLDLSEYDNGEYNGEE